MTRRARGHLTRSAVIVAAGLALGAAVLSLGFVPSLRRYVQIKGM